MGCAIWRIRRASDIASGDLPDSDLPSSFAWNFAVGGIVAVAVAVAAAAAGIDAGICSGTVAARKA